MDTSSGAPQEYPSTPGMYNLTTQADGQTVYGIHSQDDRIVPIEDDAKGVERLQAMRAPVECAILPSGDHFDYHPVIAELRKVCTWLEAVWQQS